MTDPGPAETCHLTLLVPHPTRTAVLVADPARSGTLGAPVRLPTLEIPGEQPLLSEILDAVDVVDTSTTAVLRQVITPTGGSEDADGGGGLSLVVEFDAGATAAPEGWTWQDLDPDVIARLEPETSRPTVASWALERAEGWSPLRPPWSRPGWLASASEWMVEQMLADGRAAVDMPRQHQLWGVSAVLRASSADGDVFFKCSPDIFRHEAAVTRALSERMPDLVPEVIAVDGVQGWMLMRDLGAAELGDQDESLWREGVVVHALIQRRWLGRTDELIGLGLPVRSLTDLAAQVEQMTIDDALLARMTPELRERWLTTARALATSCRRLDEIGPGPTLVHGDFHPWNVTFSPGDTRVFDWTDAAVSHPFVDLATYVFRTDDLGVRRSLVEAAVDAWSDEVPEESLQEGLALGLVVGALYQVQTYRTLLPTLMGRGADDDMAGGDVDWVNRALTRHEQGLESPV